MASLRSFASDLRHFAKYHLKRRVFDHPAREHELGLVELPFEDAELADSLRRLSDRYDVDRVEGIEYGGRSHPIFVVTSRRKDNRRALLVLSAVHGNERAGLLAVPEILQRFDEESVRLIVVAPVNPVGAAELSRYNGDGFDVNRDFVRFETREAQIVRDVFEREKPDFVVSLHEGPQDDTFMFLNRYVDLELAGRLADAIERGGSTLATKDYFGRTLHPPGVAPMSTAVWAVSWLWAATLRMKATGMWCDDRGVPEITLESSWRNPDRETRVRPHVDLVAAIAHELAADR